jgi:hypothetical protein
MKLFVKKFFILLNNKNSYVELEKFSSSYMVHENVLLNFEKNIKLFLTEVIEHMRKKILLK